MGFDDKMKEITDKMSKNKMKDIIRKYTFYQNILNGMFNISFLVLIAYTVFWVVKDLLSQSLWAYAALLLLIAELISMSIVEDSVLKQYKKAINEKDQKEVQTEHGKRR